jgi:hypothetical protein
MANLGSKMSPSTDEDREDLARMFTEMNYRPDFDCMASRRNAICEKYFLKDSADWLLWCEFLGPNFVN